MLHAVIRSEDCALHLISEVTAYNMQTLHQHLRETVKESVPVCLSIEVDPEDAGAFERFTRRWLPPMVEAGSVRVEVLPPAGAALPALAGGPSRERRVPRLPLAAERRAVSAPLQARR